MVATADQLDFLTAQAGLRARIEGQMTALFSQLAREGVDPRQIRDSVAALARTLVSEYGSAAATFAADWYNDIRLTAGFHDRFIATEYTQDFDEAIDATVRRAAGSLFGQADVAGFVESVVNKVSQYAMDGARNTVIQNAYRDPRAGGWQRVPHGKTCDFCIMLVDRGAVYKKSTANFRAHHHCDCGAVPSWDKDAKEPHKLAYEASSDMQALRDRAAKGDRSAQRQLDGYRNRVNTYIENNQEQFATVRQDYNLPAEPA
jgi:hypothetical protein